MGTAAHYERCFEMRQGLYILPALPTQRWWDELVRVILDRVRSLFQLQRILIMFPLSSTANISTLHFSFPVALGNKTKP